MLANQRRRSGVEPGVTTTRSPRLLAATTVGLVVLLAAPTSAVTTATAADAAATSAPVTCHGERATIVGARGRAVTGTPGRDVIVASGPSRVRALRGDDLICLVRPGIRRAHVADGPGDDVIDATSDGDVAVRLGDGADTYLGSGGNDRITVVGGGPDSVDTGEGFDVLEAGRARGNARSTYALGGQGDLVRLLGERPAGRVVNGGGSDELKTKLTSSKHWVFDDVRGRVRSGSTTVLRWTDFLVFELSFLRADRVDLRGGPKRDLVYLRDRGTPDAPRRVDLRLGGGNDEVTLEADASGRLDGGSGHDRLYVSPRDFGRPGVGTDPGTLTADLADGVLRVSGHRPRVLGLTQVEDLNVQGYSAVSVLGSDEDETLSAHSCTVEVDGRGGDDALYVGPAAYGECPTPSAAVARGGTGDDDLTGWYDTDDLLDGGAGSDTADGGEEFGIPAEKPDSDTCYAEVRVRCELP